MATALVVSSRSGRWRRRLGQLARAAGDGVSTSGRDVTSSCRRSSSQPGTSRLFSESCTLTQKRCNDIVRRPLMRAVTDAGPSPFPVAARENVQGLSAPAPARTPKSQEKRCSIAD